MEKRFTHLHVHTEFSLLDGHSRIDKLVKRVKELGMDSIAITDHGNMFGVIDFYKECVKNDIKPILGCEVYVAPNSRLSKTVEHKRSNHLILLAKNNKGYGNLMKLVSLGYIDGFYYKPRIDKDILKKYSEGLIALSACLAGKVPQLILNGLYQEAKAEIYEMLDIFGEGNYYLEIQDQGIAEEKIVNENLIKLSKETNVPLVATNDAHYINREDAQYHDILLCLQTGNKLDDEDRMRFHNDQFYIKSPEEMYNLFSHIPEACSNTKKVSDLCDVKIDFDTMHLPEYNAPEGLTNDEYLTKLCNEGFLQRYGDGKPFEEIPEILRDRLEYELGIIRSMGYVEYFLIVWDFINYARSQDIPVGPGRGSAAGSIVSYVLKITDIDPMKYGLIFERFLNPERVSMPDIDIDFCAKRRSEVIDYVVDKYGEDRVSQIITFGTMKARAAIRDVGRVFDLEYGFVDKIAKQIPDELKITISSALEKNEDLKQLYDNDDDVKRLLDSSMALEGMVRHASTHAAGVVISKSNLNEYVPLYRGKDGNIVAQFPMTTIEELGLLKMDFLGLSNLTMIKSAIDMIYENHGVKIDFSKFEYDDKATYDLISSGNTQGIFQLESIGMTKFMKNLKPDCFEDIIAGISLYRPGPMDSIPTYIENKKNPKNIKYLHPMLEPILSVTYGCLVYQEQVMQIVRDLGGYSYGRSDLVRRAMGKKKKEVMLKEEDVFIFGNLDSDDEEKVSGCIDKGISEEVAREIFEDMKVFAEYAFNKSHAAVYGVIAYETAYLKAHYPLELMAALMNDSIDNDDKIPKYIKNANDMGIEVLPPDINKSQLYYSVEGDNLRFGLLGIKGVGEGAINEIIEKRNQKGEFKTIFEFMDTIDIAKVNRKVVEALIKAGAFLSVDGNKAQHLEIFETLIEEAQRNSKNNISGQMTLFDMNIGTEDLQKLPNREEYSKKKCRIMEKEVLGMYLTDNPLYDYVSLNKYVNLTSEEFNDDKFTFDQKQKSNRYVLGFVVENKTILTKKEDKMSFLKIQDNTGTMDIIVFPGPFKKYKDHLVEDNVLLIKGSLNNRDGDIGFIADKISSADDILSGKQMTDKIKLRIPKHMDRDKTLFHIKSILNSNKGDHDVIVYVEESNKYIQVDQSLNTQPSKEFMNDMESLIGASNIKVV